MSPDTLQYLSRGNLEKLLDDLKRDYRIFVPVRKGEQRLFEKYTGFGEDVILGEVRTFDPLKTFFTPAREIVAAGFGTDLPRSGEKPVAVVGVKACDLKGFKIQDYVFRDHDFEDPFYLKKREESLIISSDCTCALDTCFCLAVEVRPFPEEDFDLNLSEVDSGFLVEFGSEKGRALVERYASLFEKAEEGLIRARDERRAAVTGEIEKNIRERDLPHQDLLKGAVQKKFESPLWEDEAQTCVECGACTIICPTCHCFLLYDQMDEEKMARLRVWDSCLIKDYARVAGGANPRPKLWMRLRNRFEKKFDFFPAVAGVYACTGCGRCISACPAKIDIREVLRRLVSDE